jgi:tetratricopeptide (TPR) repeat protein
MFKNILIIATLFLLKIDQVNAQDSVAARNFFQQDSLLKNELLQAKKLLYHTLQQNALVIKINQQVSYAFYNYGYLQNVYLSANGLQFMCNSSQTATIFFNGITDLKFKINTIENSIQSGGLVTEHKLSIGNTTLSVKQNNYNILKAIQQQFIQLQNLLNIDHFGMIAFKQKAIELNGMPNKTATIEEIRKYIVQAEVQAKLYNYEKAIELNFQIIATHSTAYPSAYFNVAILLAETNKLHSAIFNMQKFLLLNPNTKDEEFGKAKIAEWQIILNN